MNVFIERQIDENTKEVFGFYFHESKETLYLDSYRIMQKQTRRSKYRKIKAYERQEAHRNPLNWIKLEDVPLTDEIKKQALDAFISGIKVDIWKETHVGVV